MFLDFFVIYFFIKKIEKKVNAQAKISARTDDKPRFFLSGLSGIEIV